MDLRLYGQIGRILSMAERSLAPTAPELVLETDYARRGSRLHGVLAAFHRQWPALRGAAPLNDDDERASFREYLHRVIDDRTAPAADVGIDAALLELDRRQIRKWADKHFDHHAKYDGLCGKRGVPMQPAHFEFRFGPPRTGGDDSDPVLDMTEVPESIDCVLLNHPERPPTGAGEGSTRPLAAAVANAVFDATGVRIRRMPFTPDRIRAAMS